MDRIPLTTSGYNRIEKELHELKSVDRRAVIQAISEAREHGDLSENAEYHAAKEKQSFIEGRIQELEGVYSLAEVINPEKLSGDTIKFSATVELIDEDTEEEVKYQIVGDYEADIDQGLISISSPIARALIGKEEGDSVEFTTPKGVKCYEIQAVAFV